MTAIYSVYNKSDPSTQMPSVYLWNTPFFFFFFPLELWLLQESDKSTYMYRDLNNKLPGTFGSVKSPSLPGLPDVPRPQGLTGPKSAQAQEN